jgi:NAD(P)-dependent dehydrogenase (short-subunit alcohol dehydrogenase family)
MSEVRAIFITGGASGIGRATARLFAGRGWRVGVADVNEAMLNETAASLPGVHHRYVMDVRDRDAWRASLAAFTHDSGGRLDVLFNNAGIGTGGPLAEASFDDLDRTVAINFTGVLNGARIGYAYLAATPGSCLLNTASASAIYGSAGLATYSATKFAVRGLTEALDGEWHHAGVKVRALIPGFIETPLLDTVPPGSNRTIRETVVAAGLELTSADAVAEAAWRAVHGGLNKGAVHTYVGKTAFRLARAARWFPGSLRKQMRVGARGRHGDRA